MREYIPRLRDLLSGKRSTEDSGTGDVSEPDVPQYDTVNRDDIPSMTVREFYAGLETGEITPAYLAEVNEKVVAYLNTQLGVHVEKKGVYFDPDLDTVAKYRKYADPPCQPQDVILFGNPSDPTPWQEDQQLASVFAHEYVHINRIESGDRSFTTQEVLADFIIAYMEGATDQGRDDFLEKTRHHYRENNQEYIADNLEQLLETYDSMDESPKERVAEILQHPETYYLKDQTDTGDE